MHVYTVVLSELSVFDSWAWHITTWQLDMTLSYWLTGMFSLAVIWNGFHHNYDNQPKYLSNYSVGGARKIAAKPRKSMGNWRCQPKQNMGFCASIKFKLQSV